MIDAILSLSFNLHSHRGTYALLLGSGVSRSAGIPTGWEVTLDLASKVAHLEESDTTSGIEGWYREKFGKEPDYADLLTAIAPTAAAQQQLLKEYFEPTDDEREEGKKLPTRAHKAIARLVGDGYIRVVVTTNFDRLLEVALEAEGVAPVVIASPDAAKGAPPLAHSKCTVVKVHGDYLDHRIKNSPDDLAKYTPVMNRLLDQIFDEYGLIICGWSGAYDTALRNALERAKSRRYPMYWTTHSSLHSYAQDIVTAHNAQTIQIDSADSFFEALLEKVVALDEFDRPHPVNVSIAVSTLKRYMSEQKYRIQLRDFLMSEAEIARQAIEADLSKYQSVTPAPEPVRELMSRIEADSERLIHLFATGSFYAEHIQARSFFDAFDRIVTIAAPAAGFQVWSRLRIYPACLIAYSTGIAGLASNNYAVLGEIASRASFVKHDDEKSVPAPIRVHAHNVMERDDGRRFLLGMDRRHTPVSDYLFGILREPLRKIVPDDDKYETLFDDFEYLWCLLHVDAQQQRGEDWIWTPYGSFSWRRGVRSHWSGEGMKEKVSKAIEEDNFAVDLLAGGLFGGSMERLTAAFTEAEPKLDRISTELW